MKSMKEDGVTKQKFMNECGINQLSLMNTMHRVNIYSELFKYVQ